MTCITCIGNAPVDHLRHTEDAVLEKFHLVKGDFRSCPPETLQDILAACGAETLVPGGAVANTAWALGKLGTQTRFIGRVGNDAAGTHFFKEMQQAAVAMVAPDETAETMKVHALITPDGQRSFVTAGIPSPLHPDFPPYAWVTESDWLLVEGYLFLEESQLETVKKVIATARENGAKIALTLASTFVMQHAFEHLAQEIIGGIDLLVANEDEMRALINAVDAYKHSAADLLVQKITHTPRVITHGGEGASYMDAAGQKTFVPCESITNPIDTTGAGDAFLAGFLNGFLQNLPLETCLKQGHILAHHVIQQVGARYPHISPALFKEMAA